MATLAEVLRQAGYVTPQGQVVGPRTDLAQKLKSYVMKIPQNAAQNLANQRADIDAALTMGQGGIQIGDREAFARQMAQVPYLLGSMSNLPAVERMRIAQANAALPVSEGGLGLPANNTAAQRAKAMGYDMPMYHGTDTPNIEVFDPEKTKIIKGIFSTNNPKTASKYAEEAGLKKRAEALGMESSPNVLPLLIKSESHKRIPKYDVKTINEFRNNENKGVYRDEMGVAVTFDPTQIRSRFAAFDPKQVNNPNILAGGLAIPLAEEDNRRSILEKLFNIQK